MLRKCKEKKKIKDGGENIQNIVKIWISQKMPKIKRRERKKSKFHRK